MDIIFQYTDQHMMYTDPCMVYTDQYMVYTDKHMMYTNPYTMYADPYMYSGSIKFPYVSLRVHLAAITENLRLLKYGSGKRRFCRTR